MSKVIVTISRRSRALVAAAVATGYGYQSSPANRPWPPDVQKVSAELADA